MSAIEEDVQARLGDPAAGAAGLVDVIADPSPATDVREMLQLFRERGYPFEQAWSRAIRSLPQRGQEINEWHFQLRRTKSAWRAAYEGYSHGS